MTTNEGFTTFHENLFDLLSSNIRADTKTSQHPGRIPDSIRRKNLHYSHAIKLSIAAITTIIPKMKLSLDLHQSKKTVSNYNLILMTLSHSSAKIVNNYNLILKTLSHSLAFNTHFCIQAKIL